MLKNLMSWIMPKKELIALVQEVPKNYKLFFFNPQTVQNDGYVYCDCFATQQECENEAFANGYTYYRIELMSDFGACLKFESPWEEIFENPWGEI